MKNKIVEGDAQSIHLNSIASERVSWYKEKVQWNFSETSHNLSTFYACYITYDASVPFKFNC